MPEVRAYQFRVDYTDGTTSVEEVVSENPASAEALLRDVLDYPVVESTQLLAEEKA